jgi:hypothetical protein
LSQHDLVPIADDKADFPPNEACFASLSFELFD